MEEPKIYTRKGDFGATSLPTGERVSKSNLRVQTYGTIDELNAWLGTAKASARHSDIKKLLGRIQIKLMTIASLLASKAATLEASADERPLAISEADVVGLERCIDYFNLRLPHISNFIVPGQNQSSALLDVARTVCRRAERMVVELSESEIVDPILRKFLNRLADLLFVLERAEYHFANFSDKFWK
ncbi:MAG: cob(I)yrinic acid a,c-diamide adenosyltransferase [bacterium]